MLMTEAVTAADNHDNDADDDEDEKGDGVNE